MNLGEPEHVEAPAVGGFDLLEALVERVGVALAFNLTMKFVVPAEFHGGSLSALRLNDPAKTRPWPDIPQMPMFDPPYNLSAWRAG